jgi:hypothetical protein
MAMDKNNSPYKGLIVQHPNLQSRHSDFKRSLAFVEQVAAVDGHNDVAEVKKQQQNPQARPLNSEISEILLLVLLQRHPQALYVATVVTTNSIPLQAYQHSDGRPLPSSKSQLSVSMVYREVPTVICRSARASYTYFPEASVVASQPEQAARYVPWVVCKLINGAGHCDTNDMKVAVLKKSPKPR